MSWSQNSSTTQFNQPPPAYYASHPAEAEQDANDLINAFLNGNLYEARRGRIERPICLPQMENGFDMPFARAYPPGLADFGISKERFIEFLDGLNTAMIASPPLQVVDLVGFAVGFVPNEIVALVGGGIQAGAQIGIRILSKSLADRYMRAANERIFAPAGLRARICKSPAMRALIKIPWDEARPSKLQRFRDYVHMETIGWWIPPPPPPGYKTLDPRIADPLARRLAPYDGYMSPISFDVPPPGPPSSLMKKVSNYAVHRRRKNLTKKAEDAAARRQLLAGVPVSRELTKKDLKVIKKLGKGKHNQVSKKVQKEEMLEKRANEKVLWLVIVNDDEDQIIQGTERVDNSGNDVTFNGEEIRQAEREFEEYSSDNDSKDELEMEDYPRNFASSSRHQLHIPVRSRQRVDERFEVERMDSEFE
ncbi:hypothetical protein SCHPADRAFT_924360 [Schizopora paradoxa]|uniref:Uncharacterized protein n=1 Tax=Schizopora paradoxa TaxID=27342 RepID=A0A0H2SQU0_9AGAM|nr:hypothetical protein SCHPADRAFT_924360 [Schizopora paradoxa]